VVGAQVGDTIALESQGLGVHSNREANEHLSTEQWDDAIQVFFPSSLQKSLLLVRGYFSIDTVY